MGAFNRRWTSVSLDGRIKKVTYLRPPQRICMHNNTHGISSSWFVIKHQLNTSHSICMKKKIDIKPHLSNEYEQYNHQTTLGGWRNKDICGQWVSAHCTLLHGWESIGEPSSRKGVLNLVSCDGYMHTNANIRRRSVDVQNERSLTLRIEDLDWKGTNENTRKMCVQRLNGTAVLNCELTWTVPSSVMNRKELQSTAKQQLRSY